MGIGGEVGVEDGQQEVDDIAAFLAEVAHGKVHIVHQVSLTAIVVDSDGDSGLFYLVAPHESKDTSVDDGLLLFCENTHLASQPFKFCLLFFLLLFANLLNHCLGSLLFQLLDGCLQVLVLSLGNIQFYDKSHGETKEADGSNKGLQALVANAKNRIVHLADVVRHDWNQCQRNDSTSVHHSCLCLLAERRKTEEQRKQEQCDAENEGYDKMCHKSTRCRL